MSVNELSPKDKAQERERRLVAVAELLPRRLTYREYAKALEKDYPEIIPVTHTTIARDVGVILNRFQADTRQHAGKAFLADLAALDSDERKIDEIIYALADQLIPKKGSPDLFAVDRFIKLLTRKEKILQHRCKLLGLDAIPEDKREQSTTGLKKLSFEERADEVMAILERGRTRRDSETSTQLPN